MADNKPKIGARVEMTGFDEIGRSFQNLKSSGKKAFDDIGSAAKKAGQETAATAKTAGTAAGGIFGALKDAAGGVVGAVTGIGKAAGAAVGAIADIGKTVVGAGGIAGGALTAIYLGLQSLTLQTANSVTDIESLADAAGVSTAEMSALASAARQVNVDVGQLGGGLSTLSQNILSAAVDPASQAAKAFFQLGLSARNADGSLKSPVVSLFEMADRLRMVQNGALRAKIATDLLGGGATKLFPLLMRGSEGIAVLAENAAAYGTAFGAEFAAFVRSLLEGAAQVSEALKGVGLALLQPWLPFFTETSGDLAAWLIAMRGDIQDWSFRVADVLRGVRADFTSLLFGNYDAVQGSVMQRLIPVARVLRSLVADISDVLQGGSITRSRWLLGLYAVFVSLVGAAVAFGNAILRVVKNLNGGELPTVEQALKGISHAIDQVVLGFSGIKQGVDLKWAANLGSAARTVINVLGLLVTALGENGDSITAFVDMTLKYMSDGFLAIGQILSGKAIGEGQQGGNSFEFMQPIVDDVSAGIAKLKEAFVGLYGDIKGAFAWFFSDEPSLIGSILRGIGNLIAWAFGLENWRQLGIVALILYLTGAFGFITTVVTAVAGVIFAVLNLGRIIASVVGAVIEFGGAIAGLGGAATLGIGALIAGLTVGLGYLLYKFWPEIKAGFSKLGEWIGNVFSAIGRAAEAVWRGIGAVWSGGARVLESAFDGAEAFFGTIFDGIGAAASGLWDTLISGAGSAWGGVQSAWSGAVDFFGTTLGTIGGFFSSLWDKAKSGASSAWDAIKSFFGFGGQRAPVGDDGAPRFAEGGVVRGPGGTDRVRSWLTDGEGVLTTRAMRHYGSHIVDALNSLAVPSPALAGIPIPAAAAAGGPGRFALSVGNIDVPGLYADGPDTVRAMKRIFRNRAGRTGPRSSWRGNK